MAGYRDAFPAARFELDTPPDACFMRGAPDLIVQMLDKLVENAVDFCPPSGLITVRLARVGQQLRAQRVANDGPPIPEAMLGRLFESLFEHREGHDDRPHFGLGLYIVRLIAEFHGGSARAANRGGWERRLVHRGPADDLAGAQCEYSQAEARRVPFVRQQPALALETAAVVR